MGTLPLLDKLTKTKRRESAGSDVSARFDYQKNWALCEMLKRHHEGIEYLVAFEFHDDVLFFSPETDPTAVDFLQVKTSKSVKARTISSITSGTPSVIGKMATNAEIVGHPFSVRLILVSNTPFEFSADDISGNAITEPHRKKLLASLKKEFPNTEAALLQKLHFVVANLPVDEMDALVKGKAVELFEKRFGLDFTQNATSWLRLIQGEIRRRNNYPDDKIKSVKDLLENKCIGRSLIEQTLNRVETDHRTSPDLTFIKNELQKDGWTATSLVKLDKAIPAAAADYNDPANTECRKLVDTISKIVDQHDIENTKLSALIDNIHVALSATQVPKPYQDKYFIAALGVLICYEKL